jgi:SAM-dependent methyltransferase
VDPGQPPKLYSSLAGWFHLLTAPADYEEEAAFFRKLLAGSSKDARLSVLELGSGGGNNASHLKAHFQMTLVDISPEMLELSRSINPECEHIQGDMRSLRLGRLFDAVFLHDAVSYIVTEEDLAAAIATAYEHCRPGGRAVFAPDYVRETFHPSTDHGGHDGTDRGMRYLEWTWDPDPADSTYIVDFAYLLREPDGSVSVVHDRHEEGAFPRDVWLSLLGKAGFRPELVPFTHSEVPMGAEVFLGVRP